MDAGLTFPGLRASARSFEALHKLISPLTQSIIAPQTSAQPDTGTKAPEDPAVLFRAMHGREPYPWQVAYLRTTNQPPCQAGAYALCSRRQGGKSSVVATRAAHRMLRWSGQEVVILAKTERQAKRLKRKIATGLAHYIPSKEWPVDNSDELELPNGNTLFCLPGGNPDGIRSFSPTLLLLDEAAFVTEALIAAISPMLATTRGDWDMLSSADGPIGTFYEAMEGSQVQDWTQFVFTADDEPTLSPEFLAKELRRLGKARYLREYFCKFVAPEGAFFSLDSISTLLEGDGWAHADIAPDKPKPKLPPLDEEPDIDDMEDALDPVRHPARHDYDRFFE